jgi:hypothetical protein
MHVVYKIGIVSSSKYLKKTIVERREVLELDLFAI